MGERIDELFNLVLFSATIKWANIGTRGTDRLGRFVQRACPHVRRDTTAYRGQRLRSPCQRALVASRSDGVPRTANVTGVAISGRGATSALPAATSQTRRYFSISSIMNLPASAGRYSVPMIVFK